jgi:hypothetical protein
MKSIRILLLSSVTLFSGIFMYGQARDASVMIEKENRNAVMISIDQPEKITRDALQQRLERSGLKERSKEGVIRYKGVTLSEISPDKIDIYTKVEAGPNNSSVVYMAVSRGYDNFTNSVADSAITQNVKTFLESLVKDADTHSADVGITNQIKGIVDDEKKYVRLLEEQKDLQKKKLVIDNRLVEIQNELSIRSDEINKKKSGVEDSKTKRGNIKGQ